MVDIRNVPSLAGSDNCGVPDPVLLLTATVDPRNTPFVKRQDPRMRLRDYGKALKLWLADPATPSIVFAENSGYDITELMKIHKTCNPRNTSIEFISFADDDYDRTLGKGYGELRIIAHALRHSQTIRPQARLIKVTGRLYLSNIRSLVEGIGMSPQVDVFCNFRHNLTWADSRVFCASRRFFDRFMIPMQEEINDAKGVVYEHVLARAAHRCLAEGLQWAMMPCALNVVGMSATYNKAYPQSRFSMVQRELFRRIRSWALAH